MTLKVRIAQMETTYSTEQLKTSKTISNCFSQVLKFMVTFLVSHQCSLQNLLSHESPRKPGKQVQMPVVVLQLPFPLQLYCPGQLFALPEYKNVNY